MKEVACRVCSGTTRLPTKSPCGDCLETGIDPRTWSAATRDAVKEAQRVAKMNKKLIR